MSYNISADSHNAVAIVGWSCRFPGATTVQQYWENLRDGIETIRHLSDREIAQIDPSFRDTPRFVAVGSLLERIEYFDAEFFGLSPRDAAILDPQHRLLLECAWEALENAGYGAIPPDNRTGVYVGTGMNSYYTHVIAPHFHGRHFDKLQLELGNDKDFAPTRISYLLGLNGPSMAIQSACSTSLVTIHLACQGLLTYDCDMAIAGGATVMIPHYTGYHYEQGGILSPDGHCRPFDAQAQGTVLGSGVGLVVLQRVEDAMREGATIYGIIKGSAINNDGSAKVGYTAPSRAAQTDVILQALANAQVNPETIGMLEAHGTGTALGDLIEFAALTHAYRMKTAERGFCALGSVKGNIGHTDAAAGISSFIKATLALYHQQIPATVHYTAPNPQIELASSPFYINQQRIDWPAGTTPRRSGVSAFGIGGTNAHVILEEAPEWQPSSEPQKSPYLLTLSAKTPQAMEALTHQMSGYLQEHPEVDMASLAFTLQRGRCSFPIRRAIVCHNRNEALTILRDASNGQSIMESSPSVEKADDELKHALTAIGQAWVAGVDLVWDDIQMTCSGRRIPLPTYPFERQRYWFEDVTNVDQSADLLPEKSWI